MPSNHLGLCRPLVLPSIFPTIRVFFNESALPIRWPKYWSFSISPSNEYSRLVSFRIDWFDQSLCCAPETITPLLIGYTPIQNKNFKKSKSHQIRDHVCFIHRNSPNIQHRALHTVEPYEVFLKIIRNLKTADLLKWIFCIIRHYIFGHRAMEVKMSGEQNPKERKIVGSWELDDNHSVK